MKLKYYLRGVGIGLIFAAIVMGIALSKRGRELTDAEIMERARKLGMVEAEGTLTDYAQNSPEGSNEGAVEASGNAGSGVSEKTDKKGAQDLGEEDGIVVAPLVPQNTEEKDDAQSEPDDSEASASPEDQAGDEEDTEAPSEADSSRQENSVDDTSSETQVNTEAKSAESSVDTQAPVSEQNESSSDFINPTYIEVSIPKGVGSETVSSMLERAGLVDNGILFNRYLVENRLDRIIRSGNRRIPTGTTYEQLAKIITSE